jgi:predicted phosphodiesterase
LAAPAYRVRVRERRRAEVQRPGPVIPRRPLPRIPKPGTRHYLGALAALTVWVLVTLAVGSTVFLNSSRSLVLATHDAELEPSLDGYIALHTGPVLPDVRQASGGPIGVDITLGKTDAASVDELLQRYAYIASQPEGQVAKVREALGDMVVSALLRGALVGLVPLVIWWLVGRRRRDELIQHARKLRLFEIALVLVLAAVVWWEPWNAQERTVAEGQDWTPLAEFLGPDVPLPDEVADLQVLGDVTTEQTRRLIESAISTYDQSKTFYTTAAEEAATLDLRVPAYDETVVLLISDRHDNIGMDKVARAVGDAGGATVVVNAGDDTSVGRTWEAFSLDSVTSAFEDYDRFAVAGNHDHGTFVRSYLGEHGWTMLEGTTLLGPSGIRLLGVDDPRSSGLGNWRDETGLSFAEVGDRLADAACEAQDLGRRVATLVVHDANLGAATLERGCADLVVGGHTHVQAGPTRIQGENGATGYTYTTGTTGGAAYAIALGSKPRRPAGMSLITYREGRPVGVQAVTLQTTGVFEVGDFVSLAPVPPLESPPVVGAAGSSDFSD